MDSHYGASLLVFAVDPDYFRIYFWLARERFVRNWSGSLTWSDFGGRAEEGEDPEDTAAREFQEESLSVIPVNEQVKSSTITQIGCRCSHDGIAQDLRRGQYMFKVSASLPGSSKYITFVKQVAWRPEARILFEKTQQDARYGTLCADHPCWANGVIPDTSLEKIEIRMFSIPQLHALISSTHQRKRTNQRLRWGFHLRLKAILQQFPSTCCVYTGPVPFNVRAYDKYKDTPEQKNEQNDLSTRGSASEHRQ